MEIATVSFTIGRQDYGYCNQLRLHFFALAAGYYIILYLEFQSLLKGEAVCHQQEEDDVMISGESSTQPSPPPPDSHLVTAQLEGSTLTRAQYNTIHSLTSSLLCIPTGDMVYDGHTLSPLTLHWHYYTISRRFIFLSHYTAMAQEGIRKFCDNGTEIIIPHLNVSETFVCIVCHRCPCIHRRSVFSMLLGMGIKSHWIVLWELECQLIVGFL